MSVLHFGGGKYWYISIGGYTNICRHFGDSPTASSLVTYVYVGFSRNYLIPNALVGHLCNDKRMGTGIFCC